MLLRLNHLQLVALPEEPLWFEHSAHGGFSRNTDKRIRPVRKAAEFEVFWGLQMIAPMPRMP
jgi:hypothetical protein